MLIKDSWNGSGSDMISPNARTSRRVTDNHLPIAVSIASHILFIENWTIAVRIGSIDNSIRVFGSECSSAHY